MSYIARHLLKCPKLLFDWRVTVTHSGEILSIQRRAQCSLQYLNRILLARCRSTGFKLYKRSLQHLCDQPCIPVGFVCVKTLVIKQVNNSVIIKMIYQNEYRTLLPPPNTARSRDSLPPQCCFLSSHRNPQRWFPALQLHS